VRIGQVTMALTKLLSFLGGRLRAGAACALALALLMLTDAPTNALPAPACGQPAAAGARVGLHQGDKVPSFYVRAVTGSLKNRSVCYVCRFGDRPVVMVLVRHWHQGLPELVKNVDRQIDGHRALGLRGFVVFTTDNRQELLPRVQTLAFDGKIEMPLTIAAATAEGPDGRTGNDDEPAVSVVLYREQTVHAAIELPQTEWKPDALEDLSRAVRALVEADSPSET
jgi:hypothetical protein